ncbi:MAG: hypothetical protein WC836_19245 [Desulfobacula sp.]|jgi:pilus assembly protein FimV
MSDPTNEEDSLISQDDIDKLLESNSIEDAEDKFASDDDGVEELGELSQDDIDSLMNSNLSIQEDSLDILDKLDEPDKTVIEEREMELISQDDIDQLMNSNLTSGKDPAFQKEVESISDEEDFDEISQDDIDRLMNSNSVSEEKTVPALEDDEEFEELSKDDIKTLMGGQESTSDKKNSPDLEARAGSSMNLEDDILTDKNSEEVIAPLKENRQKQDDFIISESDAVGVSDCLINQNTIDGLIKNFNTDPAPDPVILDEEPYDALKSKNIPESSVTKTPLEEAEDFLKPVSDPDVLELSDDRGDVTQEDIDALLTEPDDEEETEDDILISQDDIDTLLMAADQEDEDVLGELIDKGLEGSLDSTLDEDVLEKEISDETEDEEDEEDEDIEDISDEEENEDQVVLQGDDEVAVKPKKKKKKSGTPWYKKKLVLASLSVLVILGITVPITYFLFFSGEQKAPEIVNAPHTPEVSTHTEVKIATVEAPVKQPVVAETKNPGHMVLKGFIILAPDVLKNITYVTADITIDYEDQKAFQEIQNNLSYFRDLIYESITKSLVVSNMDKITETEILSMVETTLKKALPANSISRVSFLSFKIS